jgi:DNA-directed RNA polymerase beta subunit
VATIQFRSVQQRDELGNPEEFTSDGGYVVEAARLAHIQDDGLPRIGTPVVSGTLLIAKFGATKAYRRENLPNDLELLTSSERALIEKYQRMFYDASVYAPAGTVGRVANAYFTHADGQTVAVVEVEPAVVSGTVSNGSVVDEERPGWSLECPNCIQPVRYTVLNISGGRELFLYSDATPDFILRNEDADLVAQLFRGDQGPTIEDLRTVYRQLEETLAACPNGGRFRLWANVRCPHCICEFPYAEGTRTESTRCFESTIIWVEGATAFRGANMPGNRLVRVQVGG